MKFGNRHGSQLAAWWNIVICGSLFAGSIYFGINQSSAGFLFAVIPAAMEVKFARTLLAIRREQADVRAGTFEPSDSGD